MSVTIKSGRDFNAKNYLGESIALVGKEYRPSIKTVNGNRPAFKVDAVILSGPDAGFVYDEALVFQKALISQLKRVAAHDDDTTLVGTVVERDTESGEFQYLLIETPTDAELVLAAKYGV